MASCGNGTALSEDSRAAALPSVAAVVATVRAPIVTVLYDRGGAYDRSSSRAGGFRISDGFISPLDLVEIGLVSADEASKLHALETAAPANAG